MIRKFVYVTAGYRCIGSSGRCVPRRARSRARLPAADRLVGVIVLCPQDDHFYVDNVAVDPSSQGLGLGVRLLDYADRSARPPATARFDPAPTKLMVKNLSYYPRRGSVETHRSADPGFRRVHFRKLLPPS